MDKNGTIWVKIYLFVALMKLLKQIRDLLFDIQQFIETPYWLFLFFLTILNRFSVYLIYLFIYFWLTQFFNNLHNFNWKPIVLFFFLLYKNLQRVYYINRQIVTFGVTKPFKCTHFCITVLFFYAKYLLSNF